MNIRKAFSAVALLFAFTILLPVAHADDWNQAIQITVNQPVQIPGHLLKPGTYWFQLADTGDRETVRIFQEDRTTLVATLHTVRRERQLGNGEVAITLADRGSDQPKAIVAWFYVGEPDGHEFLYSKQESRELARATQTTVVAGD